MPTYYTARCVRTHDKWQHRRLFVYGNGTTFGALSSAGELVPASAQGDGRAGLDGHHADPKSFLLAVMNDPGAAPELRVKAAAALLPYFEASTVKKP